MCVPPKFICWRPNPQYDVIWRCGFWEIIWVTWGSYGGTSFLIRRDTGGLCQYARPWPACYQTQSSPLCSAVYLRELSSGAVSPGCQGPLDMTRFSLRAVLGGVWREEKGRSEVVSLSFSLFASIVSSPLRFLLPPHSPLRLSLQQVTGPLGSRNPTSSLCLGLAAASAVINL